MSGQGELLACPFCGGPAQFTQRAATKGEGGQFVCFIACYCGGYSACAHKAARGATPEDAMQSAAELWNTRAETRS